MPLPKDHTYTKSDIMREVNLAKKNIRQANRTIGRVTFHDWAIHIHEGITNRYTLLIPYTVVGSGTPAYTEHSTYRVSL